MRLAKFVAHATGLTRSQTKRAIKDKRVTIDGEVVKESNFSVKEHQVRLDGKVLQVTDKKFYIALYKQQSFICSNINERYPSALNLLSIENFAGRDISEFAAFVTNPLSSGLYFAGRLDQDTTGLALLSNDGQWIHRVTSPNVKCGKTYHASLAEPISDQQIRILESGVTLKGDDKPTEPCEIERISETSVKIKLYEGRYHQVKRMFGWLGNKVVSLKREKIGTVTLDGLEPGQWRELNLEEIRSFLNKN